MPAKLNRLSWYALMLTCQSVGAGKRGWSCGQLACSAGLFTLQREGSMGTDTNLTQQPRLSVLNNTSEKERPRKSKNIEKAVAMGV